MDSLEIKRYPGKLINRKFGNMMYYLDQLGSIDTPDPPNSTQLLDSDNWIPSNYIGRYLRKTYNISIQEYYNLINGFKIDYFKQCEICNNPVRFVSLCYGYGRTCSFTCRDRLQSDNMINYYRTTPKAELMIFKSSQHQWWNDNNYIKEFIDECGFYRKVLSSVKVICTWNYKKFLNNGSLLEDCVFYIAKTETEFKFGVYHGDKPGNTGWYQHYIKVKVISHGSRLEVGTLEYLIKLDMKLTTEYIPWTRVSEFRYSFRNNSKYIQSHKFNDYRKQLLASRVDSSESKNKASIIDEDIV